MYNFVDAIRWQNEWIKACATCMDRNSNFMVTKKCRECTRNPFSICGEDKIDWYNHFNDKDGRVEKEKKYLEEKKRKFLEAQEQRKKKAEGKSEQNNSG